jgi:site-specific recombinase XerD
MGLKISSGSQRFSRISLQRFGFFFPSGLIPQPHPHLLRHSAGTFWIKSGGSSAILQKILAHTTQSTTQLYIHLAGSDVKEWHNRFSPGDKVGEG